MVSMDTNLAIDMLPLFPYHENGTAARSEISARRVPRRKRVIVSNSLHKII